MRRECKSSLILLSLISILVLNTLIFSTNVTAITVGNRIKYSLNYDSGDGTVNSETFIYNVTQIGVTKDSVPCFKSELSISNGISERRIHAPLVGIAIVTVAEEKQWRSEKDLYLVHRNGTITNVPIVGTVYAEISYRNYNNYPGWPYRVDQNWTYEAYNYLSSWLMRGSYTDWWSAKVVSDSAIVSVGGTNYTCYEVVHMITSTNVSQSSGGGVGSTITEYWIKSGILPVPVKMVDNANYIGQETRVASQPSM